MKRIVLASASPRRSELLKQLKIEFDVVPSGIPEVTGPGLSPEEQVQALALAKASDVAANTKGEALVIGADTLVVQKDVLGKPETREQAFEMLQSLEGKWHEVITGLVVMDAGSKKYIQGFERTRVKMRPLSADRIDAYISTGEPMDKAGAYGIQGMGALLVEKIEGCYFNVVGLPLMKLSVMLEKFGLRVL